MYIRNVGNIAQIHSMYSPESTINLKSDTQLLIFFVGISVLIPNKCSENMSAL
jgi:hypothetical protein